MPRVHPEARAEVKPLGVQLRVQPRGRREDLPNYDE